MSKIAIYVITFLMAMCSMIYELLIAQTVSTFAYNTVIWYSLVIGVFIASLAMGSLYFSSLSQSTAPERHLFKTELILTLIGGLSVICIYVGHMLYAYFHELLFEEVGYILFLSVAFVFSFFIGFLSGLELPLILSIAKNNHIDDKQGLIIGLDYFGALCAGLMFPVLFFNYFELSSIGFVTALVNIIVACILLFESRVKLKKKPLLILIILIVLVLINNTHIEEYFKKKYYYYNVTTNNLIDYFKPIKNDLKIQSYSSPYQKIDLVQVEPYPSPFDVLIKSYSPKTVLDKDYPLDYILFINRTFQFWSNFEELYHEYFAHIPIQMHQNIPQNILVLGAGDGLLVRELLKYSNINSITLVELDKVIIQMAKNNAVLKKMNSNSLSDPRVNIIIQDAFTYMRENTNRYDAIYIDFPSPFNFDLSKLYSREFYAFIRRALKQNGFAVLDAPSSSVATRIKDIRTHQSVYEDWQVYENTFKSAGFKHIYPFYTSLESTNKLAREILWNYLGDTQEMEVTEEQNGKLSVYKLKGKQAIVNKILEDFTSDYLQRFVVLSNKEEPLNQLVYTDFNISTHVLNTKRYPNAFLSPQSIERNIDYNKINTIGRPILPGHHYDLKLPF